jgi:hypothetical protein
LQNSNFYFDLLRKKATGSAHWRERLASQFNDPRNSRAAAALKRLAHSEFQEVEQAVWQRLAPHLESESFPDFLNETNRAVGFHFEPLGINGYLHELARRIGRAA